MSDDMSQENESTIKDDEIQSEVKKKQFYSINLTAERVFLIFVLLVAIIAVIVVAFVFSTSSKTVTKNKDVASEEVIDEIVSNDDFAFFDDENAMELLDGEEDAVPVPEKVTITENKENAAEAANSENTANVATEGNVTQEETVAAKPEVKIEDKISYSSNYAEKDEKTATPPQPITKSAVDTSKTVEKKVAKSAVQEKKWIIQIGSFTSEKSANNVADFYKKDNYPAYVKEFMKDGKTYYRLRIGPYDSDTKAQEALIKIKSSKYGKDSFVSVGYF
jgi:cell division septation protein DedD